ncbi:MAG: hypothetical protein HAW63_02825 [Bdellovibrionaceae bacterium]|nr:hypothetical protein [Pseudobdellovibrionaceae bacterium]
MKSFKSVKALFYLITGAVFLFSISCSKAGTVLKPLNENINTDSVAINLETNSGISLKARKNILVEEFEKEGDFSCSEVADRYWSILNKFPYIGNRPEFKEFFTPKVLNKAIKENVFLKLDFRKIFFTKKERKTLSSANNANVVESLLANDCTWYDTIFKLKAKKTEKLKAWLDTPGLNTKIFSLFKKFPASKKGVIAKGNPYGDLQSIPSLKNFETFELLKHIQKSYYNIKQYFVKHPYKNYNDKKVLNEVVFKLKQSLIVSKNTNDKYHKYLSTIVSSLDAHSQYHKLTKETRGDFLRSEGSAGLGITLSCFKEGCLVHKVFKKGGAFGKLKAGDFIISANSVNKAGLSEKKFISIQLKGGKGSVVNLKIIRIINNKEKSLEVSVTRDLLQANRFDAKLLDGNTAYIKLAQFYRAANGFSSSSQDFIGALAQLDSQADSLIIDLQNNPGGSVEEVVNILAALTVTKERAVVNENQQWSCGKDLSQSDTEDSVQLTSKGFFKIHRKKKKVVYAMPMLTTMNAAKQSSTLIFFCDTKPYFLQKPIVVLINEGSASASEILSLGLKDTGRALILGAKHSFGKGSGQRIFQDDALRITTFLWGSFLGTSIQWKGVESDIVLHFSDKKNAEAKKLADKKLRLEKNLPRALPLVVKMGLPSIWKENGAVIYESYKKVQEWIHNYLAKPLNRLSQSRQVEKIKEIEAAKEEKDEKDEKEDAKAMNKIVLDEAVNILKDWKALGKYRKAEGSVERQKEDKPLEGVEVEKNWNDIQKN